MSFRMFSMAAFAAAAVVAAPNYAAAQTGTAPIPTQPTSAAVPGTVMPTQSPSQTTTPIMPPPTTAPVAPPAATNPTGSRTLTVPVVGSAGNSGTLSATLTIGSFSVQNGQVVATGALTGLVTSAAGNGRSFLSNVTLPVAIGQTSCQAITGTLGPGTVPVAGMNLNLGQIALSLTDNSGGADTLGGLMCGAPAVVSQVNGLANLLNQILAAL